MPAYQSSPHSRGQRHRARYGGTPTSCLLVGVGAERAAPIGRSGPTLERPSYHPPRGPLSRYGAAIHRELTRGEPLSALAIEGILLEMVVAESRLGSTRTRPAPRWLAMVHEQLHVSFRTGVSHADLAALAQVHSAHLSRTFRRHMGCTIAAYIRELRLEWAKTALLDEGLSIGSVAAEAGFSDQSEFSRRFNQAVGITPSEYRRI